jgi:hypothetical protein
MKINEKRIYKLKIVYLDDLPVSDLLRRSLREDREACYMGMRAIINVHHLTTDDGILTKERKKLLKELIKHNISIIFID